MAERRDTRSPSWRQTAWYGAEAGAALALLYGMLFTFYAVARATSAILATPEIDGGLAATLAATWISLAVPALVVAIIAAVPAGVVGALTAIVLRGLVSRAGVASRPGQALAAGVALCLGLSLALLALVMGGLGIVWVPATAEALTFWLLAPLVVYSIAGGVAGWRACRMAPI
jgi:hypothetical protein